MGLLRNHSIVYNYYQHEPTGNLVAIERDKAKEISKLYKKFKRADKISDSEKVLGYFFVLDEEFDSLKIDFSEEVEFQVNQLQKADIN